ncbi:MAG: peptidoglycan DD-metalloendopeptidase family protein [Mangrovibacterium sp.]
MKRKYLIGILIILCSGVLAIFILQQLNKEKTKPIVRTPPPPALKFGFPVDSFHIEQATIRNNQNLSDILSRKGISMQTIDQIVRTSTSIFDVRKMKKNNHYYFFSSKDSLKNLRYFIYEINQIEYVVYCFEDSLHVYKGEKPVTKKIRSSSGSITSSLWNTMEDNNLSPMLAMKLNDIYQWTIDFFGIQKGDQFRVIYEESFVDSVSIGITNVFASEFKHSNEDFYAFQFIKNDTIQYYDEKGRNLKKAFLKAPLEFSRISSHFTHSRLHPVLKFRRPHLGIDYAAASGTPVVSIGKGIVTRKGYQAGGGGNYLYIKHNSVYTTCYMHLKGFAKGITTGSHVKQGDLIGYVGSTGLATGPHLDFRVFKNGTPVDPLKIKSEPGNPIDKESLPHFTELKDSLMIELKKITVDKKLTASSR